jgi:WD40 repeat protein
MPTRLRARSLHGQVFALTRGTTWSVCCIVQGHIDEIFSCAFNYEGDTIITGSKDNTCRIWKC